MKQIPFMKQISWCLVVLTAVISVAPKANASFAPSVAIGISTVDRASDLNKIQSVIEQKMVRDRLEKYGLTKDEINSRLDKMDDDQIHNLALNLDQIRVGGDGIGLIIGLLIIAILVVVLIQLTGHKVIIK